MNEKCPLHDNEHPAWLCPNKKPGCRCACHRGQVVYHIAPCHTPLLTTLNPHEFWWGVE